MKNNRRVDWVVAITAIVFAVSCSGGGCGGCTSMEPIPGGFPANKRTANAAQVRVTPTALAAITADPAAVIGPLVGNAMNGIIEFPIPASCGGSPEICCPNGVPSATCGPLEIDLVKRPTDQPRLVLAPAQGADRLDMTIRSRVKTKMNLPIKYSGISCNVAIDTTRGSNPDLRIDAQIQFSQDPTVGTTRIAANNVTVSQLEDNDVSLSGGILCSFAGAFIGAFTGTLQDQIASTLQDTINDAVCKACDSGQVAECGSSFATACTSNVCMVADRCLQELGLDGRMRGVSLFGGFSPGTTGALDLYEVAGGYATSNNGGIALGLLGGMQPGGSARDRCGPSATEPAAVAISPSVIFQNNVLPGTTTPFDVGIGVHKQQLGQFAWAGYDGGLLCLTIGNNTVEQLSTDTLGLLSRSLGKLVETSSPMAIGLRPQSPPVITLGKNTFIDDGMGNVTLDEPLLDLTFTAMELDFFASIDDQYVRVFTVVADVHLPIGLQTTGMGEIVPVLGQIDDAFTNVSVKNSEAVTETPAELAALFPSLLNLVLPQLSGGLGGFALPEIGGLALSVTSITAVENDTYLAIFANLVTALPARQVETRAAVSSVSEPEVEIARDPKQWKASTPPTVALDFGDERGLEWSYRIDSGSWSAWSTNAKPKLASTVFWLPGTHRIDVRAREIGRPETMDRLPESIEVELGTDVQIGTIKNNGFHGTPGSSGCGCDSSGSPIGAAPFALVLLMIVLPLRRVARRAGRGLRKLGPIVWSAALFTLPGCSCGSDPCGDVECLPGEVPNGGIGRYTSIAGDDTRVIVATYDQGLGDLVAADVTDPSNVKLTVVDGILEGAVATYDPSTYRKGVEDAGPNVGTWTSIAISDGIAKISYQDRDATALKYAYERGEGQWASYTLDPGNGEDVGQHTSMTIDGNGRPAIAYLAIGNDDGAGHRVTELRIARSGVKNPEGQNDWTTHVIARGTGSCAGLCDSGTYCIAPSADGEPEACIATTSDCTPACGDGDACVTGTCRTLVADPKTVVLASGTGLFVSLVTLPDGRLAAAYYDRNARALVLAVENGADTNEFTETTLDSATPGDRGMWASAVVDGSGTIHIAYQEALGDQLLYTTWNNTPGTPEVVDDGQRPNDRPHPVGASASIYLVNGAPAIAYHDGLSSDVYVATKTGAAWTTTNIAPGPLLDGIAVAATTGHGTPYIAWNSIDPSTTPLNNLAVQTQ